MESAPITDSIEVTEPTDDRGITLLRSCHCALQMSGASLESFTESVREVCGVLLLLGRVGMCSATYDRKCRLDTNTVLRHWQTKSEPLGDSPP